MVIRTRDDAAGKNEATASLMITLMGILLGLTTAFSQCFAYIFSRLFVMRHRNAYWHLLLASHLYMGAASLVAILFIWPESLPPLRQYVLPLLGAGGFYVIAQGGLFILMRMTNPSRVAPLLGIKILILALLATGIYGNTLSPLQWIAVAACFGAVLTLNFSGGSLPLKAIGLLVLTCTGYSLSDIHIGKLISALSELSTLHAAIWGALATYVGLGVTAGIVVLLTKPRRLFMEWKLSLPFAALWMVAMLTLFVCIGLVGPVFAIILQSSRGLMSVALGAVLAHKGWSNIEPHVPRKVFIQRIAAAALMIAAVALYAYGRV